MNDNQIIHKDRSYKQFNVSEIEDKPVESRKNKLNKRAFALPHEVGGSFCKFFSSLPETHGNRHFHYLVNEASKVIREGRTLIFSLDAHIIKSGLNPYFIDWIKKGYVSAIAITGEAVVRDMEIATYGRCNDIPTKETIDALNYAAKLAVKNELGLGECLAFLLTEFKDGDEPKSKDYSLLVASSKFRVPVTVHTNLGNELTNIQDYLHNINIGKATQTDFKILTYITSYLNLGMLINAGSDVYLSSILIKSIDTCNKKNFPIKEFNVGSFGINDNHTNLINKAKELDGIGISIIGINEIMVPLFMAAVEEKLQTDP